MEKHQYIVGFYLIRFIHCWYFMYSHDGVLHVQTMTGRKVVR